MDADAARTSQTAQDPTAADVSTGHAPSATEPVAAPATEPVAASPAHPIAARRSERWAAGVPEARHPWAWLSVLFALLGVVAVVVVGMATAERAPFEDLPDRAAYVLFAAVPSFGVLALMSGLAGRHDSRGRLLAWVGLVVGAALAIGAVAVTIVLITALRTLG